MSHSGLVWFRDDLRTSDNPALWAALEKCDDVRAIYIIEADANLRPMGGAALAWLKESLKLLSKDLARLGVALDVFNGESAEAVAAYTQEHSVEAVFWNRRYGPAERDHDAAIKKSLSGLGVAVSSFNASLLMEPWEIKTKSGTSFSVFTPFWKNLRGQNIAFPINPRKGHGRIKAEDIELEPHPDWADKLLGNWKIGETAAHDKLAGFLEQGLRTYQKKRDLPSEDGTSGLSPHLRFGEIGPRQIWHAVQHLIEAKHSLADEGHKFLSELAWRDFSYHLLYYRDDIAAKPMQARFSEIEWRNAPKSLEAWQKGQTGIPIIDAGMRQLWATGWMHNRVRMLTASLLSKNLLIDWRKGEAWFWDTLVDADPANNPASWQWVAGCGADAAPYFRIFNPITQGQKFDPDGAYVRRWVPELQKLDAKYIHNPWDARDDVLEKAGINLGKSYPKPIVDLKSSRERALEALGTRTRA